MQGDLLKELTDFTDLRKKGDEFNSIASKQSGNLMGGDIDIENNQMILKSFRELREKLKNSQKEAQQLRQDIKTQQIQIIQLHESQNNLRLINHQLKEKNSQIQAIAEQFKKKNMLLKESLSEKNQLEQQLDFMKNNLVELQMKCEKMEEEKKKLIQMAVQDKIASEQRINKLMFKRDSDQKYMSEMEQELSKGKQTIIKLQNKLKKLEIKYEEQIFNKEWSKQNFQIQKYQSYIKELQSQVSELKNKFKKEKERKNQIEKRVLELEQIAGIWNVKAEAYEGEVGVMSKKVKKMQRRMSTAKVTANKMTSQKICWEERFFKAVFISEELINRVKRQLMGDMVELAKSCEFRISKLKEGKQADILRQSAGKDTFSLLNKKLVKSQKKERKSCEKYALITAKIQTDTSGKPISDGALSEINTNFKTESKPKNTNERSFHSSSIQDENNKGTTDTFGSMEMKIRKEREQMEKKLRERMLFRKIEVCTTPDKGKLRQDYLKLIFQK